MHLQGATQHGVLALVAPFIVESLLSGNGKEGL
jgi:hypothetical protein